MLDAKMVAEWFVEHNASMYDVSVKFDISIEEAYRLVKDGMDL